MKNKEKSRTRINSAGNFKYSIPGKKARTKNRERSDSMIERTLKPKKSSSKPPLKKEKYSKRMNMSSRRIATKNEKRRRSMVDEKQSFYSCRTYEADLSSFNPTKDMDKGLSSSSVPKINQSLNNSMLQSLSLIHI